jgi:TetR/AcrR family transcriptional regulator, transcriptional repressor for nem operon
MGRVSDARERLLKAAIELLWEHGYGGIRVDAVCERADVQKGSFYHFFPSKSELTVAALRHHWAAIAPEYDDLFSARFPPLTRLSRYFAWIQARQRRHKQRVGRVLGCPLLSIGCEVIEQDSAISAAVRELLRRKKRYFEALFREAKGEGVPGCDDPAKLSRALIAYVDGVVTQARIQDDLEVLQSLDDGARRFLGIGMSSRAAARRSPVDRKVKRALP